MTALYHSPFLIALGWSIAASLWQTALLWLIYQLVSNIFIKNNPALKHAVAVVLLFASFTWFGVTLIERYNEITGLTQSLTALSAIDSTTASTLLEITTRYPDTRIMDAVNMYLPYFSTAYLIVLLVLSVKLCNAYIYSRQLRTKGLVEVDRHWEHFVNRYAKQIGIARKVKINFSAYIDVPATLDFLKPVILLPVAAFNHLTTQQVESILLHELAHIRRNDYLINIIMSVVETLLFFNPFVHLLGKSLKKEREHCCDDLVLHYKFDPHSYASALLSLEKMRIGFQPLAVAATGNSNQLLGRIKRIMNVKSTQFNYGQKLLALAVIAFILISITWMSPASNKEITGIQAEKNKQAQKNDSLLVTSQSPWTATANTQSLSPQSPGSSIKSTQSERRTIMSRITDTATDVLSAPAPDIFPPVPPPPLPLSGLTTIPDIYVPGNFFAESLQRDAYGNEYPVYTPGADEVTANMPDEWVIKEDNDKAKLHSVKILEEAFKGINPGETKAIINLFQQAKMESQVKKIQLERFLAENIGKLFDPQKKFMLNDETFAKNMQKQKKNVDSIQNMNRLLLKTMNYTLKQKINFDSLQKMKKPILKKADDHRAIWIRNENVNNDKTQDISFAQNDNRSAGITLVANITGTGCDNTIQPKVTTVKTRINATPAVKITNNQQAFTMDYQTGSSSTSASITVTKNDKHTKKLVINNEESGNTLVITIEL
jgi:beta-lactamase regulating signal transducer with metallopeptidase domain